MPDRLGDSVRLQHIFDAISEIEDYTKDVDFDSFQSNSMMMNASVRQLEIIGEAAGKLSEDLRTANADITWSDFIGLRNILIHKYFGVDIAVVWDIIQQDLPFLKGRIAEMLEAED